MKYIQNSSDGALTVYSQEGDYLFTVEPGEWQKLPEEPVKYLAAKGSPSYVTLEA